MLLELHALYNKKLPGLSQDQYKLGYSVDFVEAEWIARGSLELSIDDSPKPTRSTESVEPNNAKEEAQVLPIPTGEGTSEGVVAASVELVVITLQEFPTIVIEPSRPPLS